MPTAAPTPRVSFHFGSEALLPVSDVGARCKRKSSMRVAEGGLIEEPIKRQQHLVLMVAFGLA